MTQGTTFSTKQVVKKKKKKTGLAFQTLTHDKI